MAVKNKEKKQQSVGIALDAAKQKEFTHKVKKLKEKYGGDLRNDRGVVYVGHIPHGFYETEMRSFFSQFGKVTRIRLSRSKKTGNSKGYAYVEFEDVDVAEIATETMNNYLMFERLLKCELLPSDRLHPALFHGSHRGFSKPKASSLSIDRHNSVKKEAKLKEYPANNDRKYKKKLAKLAKLGVELDIDSIISKVKKIKSTVKDATVATPDLKILVEDETEKEISFRTPPNSIRSSKLTGSGKRKKSADDTPRTTKTHKKISTPKTEEAKSSKKVKKQEKFGSPEPRRSIPNSSETPKTEKTKSSKKVKKQEKFGSPEPRKSTPNSSEKPRRMTTRSAAKKSVLSSKDKLKTPPKSGRKK